MGRRRSKSNKGNEKGLELVTTGISDRGTKVIDTTL